MADGEPKVTTLLKNRGVLTFGDDPPGRLKCSSFRLSGPDPCAVVDSAYTKNQRQAIIPLRPELATKLPEVPATKTPSAPAFRLPRPNLRIEMLGENLEAAEISQP